MFYPSPDVIGQLTASARAEHLHLGANSCQVLQAGVLALPPGLDGDDGDGDRLDGCSAVVVARAATDKFASEERLLLLLDNVTALLRRQHRKQ